jgi:hypothetical protein
MAFFNGFYLATAQDRRFATQTCRSGAARIVL